MPCARSRWAFAGVPANPATRMPCRVRGRDHPAERVALRAVVEERRRPWCPGRGRGRAGRRTGRRRPGSPRSASTSARAPTVSTMTRQRTAAFAATGSGRGAAPQRRERPPAAVALGRVARRAGREHGIRPAGHRRHDDRGGTGIQGGSDPDRVDGRHAHDERGPGIRQAPAGRVQGGAVDRAVLRVERHPVEAARREPPEQVDVGGEGPDAARAVDHPRGDVPLRGRRCRTPCGPPHRRRPASRRPAPWAQSSRAAPLLGRAA